MVKGCPPSIVRAVVREWLTSKTVVIDKILNRLADELAELAAAEAVTMLLNELGSSTEDRSNIAGGASSDRARSARMEEMLIELRSVCRNLAVNSVYYGPSYFSLLCDKITLALSAETAGPESEVTHG